MAGPPLWVVERGDARVYLFGVRPVFGDLPWLTPSVHTALDDSAALWRETPPAEEVASDPRLVRHGFSPDRPLRSRLDDATNERLERVAHEAGIDPDALQTLRPWLAAQLLRHAVYDPIWSGPTLDDLLTEMAIQRGMTISCEFDVETIIRAFADLPEAAEIDFLRMELDELERGRDAIVERYRRGMAGDLSFEEAEAQRVHDIYPDFYERLLVQRNRAWEPRIDDALRTGTTTFIAVGTMHLVGPENVRTLLCDPVRMVG